MRGATRFGYAAKKENYISAHTIMSKTQRGSSLIRAKDSLLQLEEIESEGSDVSFFLRGLKRAVINKDDSRKNVFSTNENMRPDGIDNIQGIFLGMISFKETSTTMDDMRWRVATHQCDLCGPSGRLVNEHGNEIYST